MTWNLSEIPSLLSVYMHKLKISWEIEVKLRQNWVEMRGSDRINGLLPDDVMLEIFRRLEAKGSRDACSLVCKRWLGLERLGRETIRIGASASPDQLVELLGRLFPNTLYVFVDERISVTLPFQCVSGSFGFDFAISYRFGEFGAWIDRLFRWILQDYVWVSVIWLIVENYCLKDYESYC